MTLALLGEAPFSVFPQHPDSWLLSFPCCWVVTVYCIFCLPGGASACVLPGRGPRPLIPVERPDHHPPAWRMSPREPPRTAGQVGAPTQHTCSAASGLQRDFHAVPSPFFKDARELTHLSGLDLYSQEETVLGVPGENPSAAVCTGSPRPVHGLHSWGYSWQFPRIWCLSSVSVLST